MKIAKETWIIMAIGLADLATTIIFIQHHGAQEANPLFKRYWEMGIAAFVAAKFALLLGPLCVLEWARVRNPHFVSWALRSAIVGYVLMYGVGCFKLNHAPPPENEWAAMPAPPIRMSMMHVPGRFTGHFRPYIPAYVRQAPRTEAEGRQENVATGVAVY
jgi:hypothetical protein